ncbi:hypothetical protein GBAR_LOCUS6955, partial [Geodia barretti]
MRCQTLTGDLPSVRGRCTVEWPFQIWLSWLFLHTHDSGDR